MKKWILAAAAVMALSSVSVANAATTLYYGGDFDPGNGNANGLANENDGIVNGAATYDNFTVSGGAWHVTSLFTNDLVSGLNITSANWEIRSGVSQGNGGTLLFSGSAKPVVTATGRNGFGMTELNVAVPVSFDLTSGTYWLSVQPVSSDAGRSFESNTFGINAIGLHTANQDYFNSSFFGANFTNANNEGVFSTFSSGVIGTVGAGGVPEPSTWALMLVGFGGLGASLRMRRNGALAHA